MNMKGILHTLSIGLLVLYVLTSCIDDDLIKTSNVVEGKPVTVSLKIGYKADADVVVNTRADNTLSDITRLRIFVYDVQGNYMESLNYTGNIASDEINLTKTSTTDNGHLYNATFETTSGTRKLIAIANAGGGYWQTPSVDIENTSYEDMKKAVISLSSNLAVDGVTPFQIVASSQMLLTGCKDGIVFTTDNGVTDINGNNLSPAISLRRAMARITFKIPETVSDAQGTFTPTTYQVYNVPTKTMLSNDGKAVDTSASAENFINFASVNVPSVYDGFYTFSFYMPENVYDIVENAKDDKLSMEYKDRDVWERDKGAAPEEKVWTNAPQYSTFIVLNGTYSETGTHNYTGNVSYTIHLGDFSSSGTPGNFSVERNTSYTYTVNVKGVNKIVVEAKKEGEEYQQGAEGQIYDYSRTQYSYELDAHYEQVFLEYNLTDIANAVSEQIGKYSNQTDEEIENAISNQLILIIQSEAMDYNGEEEGKYSTRNKRGTLWPYKIYADAKRSSSSSSVENAKKQVLDGNEEGTKGFDYKWIEFLPQNDTDISEYPGVPLWSRVDVSDLKNGAASVYGTSNENVTEDSKYLMDAYDVIVAMGNVVKKIYKGESVSTDDFKEGGTENVDFFTGKGITISESGSSYVARFTAFVDEYYYYKHPLTGAKITTWNVFTNKIPREMIISMSTDVSDDGNSSYSEVYSYITQLSMQTFYNSRSLNLNGFGIETYNEMPLTFEFGSPSLPDGVTLDDSDGRNNQIHLLGHQTADNNYGSWGFYLNLTQNGWLKTVGSTISTHKLDGNDGRGNAYNLQRAYSACLSRNRDLDGDGFIDPNEIRWHLASLNEYIRMGIAANVISSTARLYGGDKNDMTMSGYPSSYIGYGSLYFTSSASDKRCYWAVEKGSYSGISSSYGEKLPIRCVRVLPAINETQDISSLENIVSASTFEKIDAKDNVPIVLKFKNRLVDDLYRQPIHEPLERHNENGTENSFSEGIFISSDYLKVDNDYVTYTLGELIGYQGATERGDYYNNLTYTKKIDPCQYHSEGGYDNGWRVPNLVELSAMNAAGIFVEKNESGDWVDYTGGVACCTYFSNPNVRYGFVKTDLITCPGKYDNQIDNQYRIRCVRDVPAGYFD